MDKSLNTPHDLFFRKIMNDSRIAKDFFKNHLPKNIFNRIEINTLRIQSGTYIDSELKEQISDLLYSVRLKGKAEKHAYLYLLAEHQSKPQRLMPFRLLKYICGVMDDHYRKHKALPVVYPVVFYHGENPYNYSTDLFDLFGEQKELAKTVMFQPFHLIDLSKISDDELEKHYWSGIMEMVMKHIKARDLAKQLEIIFNRLSEWDNQGVNEYINLILTYVFNAGKISKQDVMTVAMQTQSAPLGGYMKTLAEQFREEGRLEGELRGELQGEIKGKLQGRFEGKQEVAEQLLAKGFAPELISEVTGIKLEELVVQ